MTKQEEKSKKTGKPSPGQGIRQGQKKVFDVMRPGQAPTLPRSRPVPPSAKPPVADDQFVPSAPPLRAGDPFAKKPLMNGKNKKTLMPVGEAGTDNASAKPLADDAKDMQSGAARIDTAEVAVMPANAVVTDNNDDVFELGKDDKSFSDDFWAAKDKTAGDNTSVEATTAVSAPGSPKDDDIESTWQMPDEPAPAGHLALGQTVDTDDLQEESSSPKTADSYASMDDSSDSDTNFNGAKNSTSTNSSSANSNTSKKTIEDLLAETGAPDLGSQPTPKLIVSHHHAGNSWLAPLLIFVSVLLLGAILLNFLIDAGIIKTGLDLPVTDLVD